MKFLRNSCKKLIFFFCLLNSFSLPLLGKEASSKFSFLIPALLTGIGTFGLTICTDAIRHPAENRAWIPITIGLITFGGGIASTFMYSKNHKEEGHKKHILGGIVGILLGVVVASDALKRSTTIKEPTSKPSFQA